MIDKNRMIVICMHAYTDELVHCGQNPTGFNQLTTVCAHVFVFENKQTNKQTHGRTLVINDNNNNANQPQTTNLR